MEFKTVRSKNNLLQEEALHIILVKDGKEFEASGLFFKWNNIGDEEIIEVLHTEELPDDLNAFDIVDKVIELKEKFGLPVYKDSRRTLLHWQYVEGVTNTFVNLEGKLVGSGSIN